MVKKLILDLCNYKYGYKMGLLFSIPGAQAPGAKEPTKETSSVCLQSPQPLKLLEEEKNPPLPPPPEKCQEPLSIGGVVCSSPRVVASGSPVLLLTAPSPSKAEEELLDAVSKGDYVAMVQVLDRCPFLINKQDEDGQSALYIATKRSRNARHPMNVVYFLIIQYLCKKGADTTLTAWNGRTPYEESICSSTDPENISYQIMMFLKSKENAE